MSYTVEFADEKQPLDEVVEDKGVTLLVDSKALMFLLGTTLDFETEQDRLDLHLPQPEPDLGLRLRRVGFAEGRRHGLS